jgi:hypothetical protein
LANSKISEPDCANYSELKKRVEKVEGGMDKLEKMEKSLAYHELVLAKKVADIYNIEKKIEELVEKKDFEKLKEELSRIDRHEAIIFENSKFIREIISELEKQRNALTTSKHHAEIEHDAGKSEDEEHHHEVKELADEIKKIKSERGKKIDSKDLAAIRTELSEKMNELEEQNKLLMSYLKKVDNLLLKNKLLR